jgi:AcrR family transcriptional regulator
VVERIVRSPSVERPVITRARSQRSIENDGRIIRSAISVANKNGLDGLALSEVAKKAQLTTGALYGRFEDNEDLLVNLVTDEIAPKLKRFLDQAMHECREMNNSSTLVDHLSLDTRNDPCVALGVEGLVAAQRNDALAEILLPEVAGWLDSYGINENANPVDIAKSAVTLALIFGTVMHRFVDDEFEQWPLALPTLASGISRATSSSKSADAYSYSSISADTGNAVRDALIMTTADIIAKVGYERTTVARIARRSGLTTGSIYNVYLSKQDLIVDSIDTLLRRTRQESLDFESEGLNRRDLGFGFAAHFAAANIADRRQWHRFRHEAFIAARTNSVVRKTIRQVHRDELAVAVDLFSVMNVPRELIQAITATSQALSLGFSLVIQLAPMATRGDYQAISESFYRELSGFLHS